MDPAFVFLDLETTGLDPIYDVILEIGMVIVDSELNLTHTWGRTANWEHITYDTRTGVYEPPFGVHKIVADMHTKNGIWEDCYRSTESIGMCMHKAHLWLDTVLPKDHKIPMAGNTIGFDRSFLQAGFPGFLNLFHHRSIDVSSMRVLYEEWLPDGEPLPVGNDLHRAVPDCMDSIEKLRFFKKQLFNG